MHPKSIERQIFLEVFRTISRLKELPRQGFVYFGFKGDETDSIAEHSFMVTWIVYILSKPLGLTKTEQSRVTLMALIHDWGEAVAGDLSYRVKGASFAETEKEAFYRLVEGLSSRELLKKLWDEYEDKKTRLAMVVKFADALDRWLQGLVTASTWWPAWEDYNRQAFEKIHAIDQNLAVKFRRICDMAKDPNLQIWLPDPEDSDLWNALKFFKKIYSLKELPRHGFTMFGLKRSEADSFAGHSFVTASLALLIGLEYYSWRSVSRLMKLVMIALCHDLPVALTGDAAYDLQRYASVQWSSLTNEAIKQLVEGLRCGDEIENFHETWLNCRENLAWIVKVAAAIDAWEIGVTTPTAWMWAWEDYRKAVQKSLESARDSIRDKLSPFFLKSCEELAVFEPTKLEGCITVGREPRVKPIRLAK